MTRTLLFAASGLVLVLVLALLAAILLTASPAKGDAPRAYTRLPASAFVPVPGSAGGESPRAWDRVAATPSASTPQSGPSPSATARPATKPPVVVTTATPRPGPSLTGAATWWDSWGHGFYAAAGPKIRAAFPDYLGHWVTACSGGRCVRVKLTTSCACQPDTRLIDLSLDAFSRLAAPSRGVIAIEVYW